MSLRRLTLTSVTFVLLPTAIVSLQVWAGGGGMGGGGGGMMSAVHGGKLWDKWWVTLGMDAPTGDHPLYPHGGPRSGSTTYRCKECHGWDYRGADGAYAMGSSHYTGIPGVFGSSMSASEMFDLIKRDDMPNGHGYGAYGMSDQAIQDLVEFLQTQVIDTDQYINADGHFIGDPVQGAFNYTEGGMMMQCVTCHGDDGTAINFGSPDEPVWVGTIATENPWELMHKIRFGQPGGGMPSWLMGGGSDQGAADIGRYIQLNFPTAPCRGDINGDATVDVDDLIELILRWGQDCQPG